MCEHRSPMRPETRYARTAEGVYLAYQVLGSGPDVAVDFDRGERELKGVPDRWHLYTAISG